MKNKILLLSALTFLLAGCGAAANSTPKDSVIPPTSNNIIYNDGGFSPNPITVKVGTTVTFKNQGSGPMWVASNPHPTHTDLPSFDEKSTAENGGIYSYTFTKVGSWGYHNHTNPGHTGTVIVTE